MVISTNRVANPSNGDTERKKKKNWQMVLPFPTLSRTNLDVTNVTQIYILLEMYSFSIIFLDRRDQIDVNIFNVC